MGLGPWRNKMTQEKICDELDALIEWDNNEFQFSIKYLASKLFISPDTLSFRFSRVCKINFRTYRETKILLRVLTLLEEGYNLKSIAPMVGLKHPKTIREKFGRYFGIAIADYRRVVIKKLRQGNKA